MNLLWRVVLLLMIAFAANASEETGEIRFIYGQTQSSAAFAGFTFFYLDPDTHVMAACASFERWVINNSWPAAKIQLATLLAAKLAGKKVHVQGTGNCEVYSDSETLMDVYIVE